MVSSVNEISYQNLDGVVASYIGAAEKDIDVFSPFISIPALEEIFRNLPNQIGVNIITRWQIIDFLFGSASLDIYDYCSSRGWTLFVNPRLHLKTVVRDYQSLILGSANITGRGLGLNQPSNYEVLASISQPSKNYLLYLEYIKSESIIVNESVLAQFREALEGVKLAMPIDCGALSNLDEELHTKIKKRDFFLISELPMSSDLNKLYEVTINLDADFDEEVLSTARHDIAKYSLLEKTYQSENDFINFLTFKFFSHPFVQELCLFIDRPRRFGEVKAWVQNNCTDVPVPSRRTLSGNVNVLYNWLVALGQERFITYRPNHTEVIAPKSF